MSDEPIRFLPGKRVYLRPLEQEDIPQLHRWVNQPEIRKFILSFRPMDMAAEQKWFDGLDRAMGAPKRLVFAMCLVEEDRFIGITSIDGINWIHRCARTGTLIGDKDHWGKGYGRESKELLLGYAFETLNLERINSEVIAYNERSAKHLEAAGYVLEGRRVKALFKDGDWHDELLYAVRREDWRKR